MDHPTPTLCADEAALRENLVVFLRDMHLQHREVRLVRQGRRVFCDDPRKVWIILSPRAVS